MNNEDSTTQNDAAFYRKRKAMLVYPLIVLPFLAVLFWLLGGGKGEKNTDKDAYNSKAGANGFNASMPNAKGGSMNGREVEGPGYGKAPVGQLLSNFTDIRRDSATRGLKAIAVSNPTPSTTNTPSSSLASTPAMAAGEPKTQQVRSQPNAAAIAATSAGRTKRSKGYYYNPAGNKPYHAASATDQQLDQQLKQYESSRTVQAIPRTNTLTSAPAADASRPTSNPVTVRLSDNLTASRLAEAADNENPFLTAPTGGSRTQPTRAVLSGGNYGSKKTIAWMIPVVVHEDQVIREGQQVKLRLLKEVTAEGITIPANTILYGVCQLTNDRLQLGVRSLQLNGQLIPLDLEVYDTDGSPGINVPGMASSSQVGGQMRSSAIQGIQVPDVGGLGNAVLNSARMGASNSVRQSTIRLRAGYNLFLKA